jgi:DNA recombination protein RmuC
MSLTELLLLAAVVLLVVVLVLLIVLLRSRRLPPETVESAVSGAWVKLGLSEQVGRIAGSAEQIQRDYRSLDQLIRAPTERGYLGELGLEAVLADALPPDMFGIRERVLEGLVPDANIRSTAGLICIDSKFPLDNYRRLLDCASPAERQRVTRQFLRDVQGHLGKVADDYVRPELGTAEFAFLYVPSEAVYWFLVTEGYSLLREWVKRGVQVVSPLTLAHKVELIRAGVHARKLSEEAVSVRNDILRLGRAFRTLDEEWLVFYATHLKNLARKGDDVDAAYSKLREEFAHIAALAGE